MGSRNPFSRDPLAIVLGLFAAGNLANGLWMLVSPGHWYFYLPANVPGSGPLNEHMVRDIGCIFTLIGVALSIAVVRRELRLLALSSATAYYVAHALVHVYDSARGLFPPGQWGVDLLPVYGSTLVLVAVTASLALRRQRRL